mmetsp:Transcript_80/g.111  ORF Transcript_80/g.111 Transcript_80/m.111 type:complete len:135 (+) Transcript_80:200-604(+)
MNLYAISLFIYTAILKHAVTSEGVNALDVCLIRVFVLFAGALMITCTAGKSFTVAPSDRLLLFLRSLIGTTGYTCFAFGIGMVPLLVQNTIFNSAPFWSSILSCVFLGEKMAAFEIVALFLSFGGVLCIAFSKE